MRSECGLKAKRQTLYMLASPLENKYKIIEKELLSSPKELSETSTTFLNDYFLSFHLLRAKLGAHKMTAISLAVI